MDRKLRLETEWRIATLWEPVRDRAMALLNLLDMNDYEMYVPPTGALRNEELQKGLYGRDRFTLHYIGAAVDFLPRIDCKAKDWQREFNAWPHWDRYQKDLAVMAGFDEPRPWQLTRDRPHLQYLGGVGEDTVRVMWESMRYRGIPFEKRVDECRRYLNLHVGA